MKRILVILFVLLAVFAFASCKQDIKNGGEEAPKTPVEPEPVDPIVEPGVLFVRPGEGYTYSQAGKFQFRLDVPFNANESIEMLALFSSDIKSVVIRQAEGDNAKFNGSGVALTELEKVDGWYKISIPADDVVPSEGDPVDSWVGLGITCYTDAVTRANCFVAIKGLKLNDVAFDISDWEEEDCAIPYYTSPSVLDVTLTPLAE